MSAALDRDAVNTLRFLSVDQVEAANSGHPGLPLGAAAMAYALFRRHLRFDPARPDWANRDRFILSAGHGSALIYSLLHVVGYELPLDELKRFRQLGSRTPGHPEFGWTPGVEATTGPLGQGAGMAVGMALAERFLRETHPGVFDHRIYALVSDGDLMEGIASEACSLAGTQKLGRLIFLYDANDISLDGPTSHAFTEDVAGRFRAYGWQVLEIADGNDVDAIDRALVKAQAEENRPSILVIRTVIGYGSPKAGTSAAHGSPLGAAATLQTKKDLGWPEEPAFHVPEAVKAIAADARDKGAALSAAWDAAVAKSGSDALQHILAGTLPEGWDSALNALEPKDKEATRDSGKAALNAVAAGVPWLIGGSADLVSSTKTEVSGSPINSPAEPAGRNIWFGVREHGMGAAVNGLALTGLPAFGSTFLVFSDYMRGAIRLSALMKTKSIWVFTHDSVFVGEDGPTHQPIEQVQSLRLIPGLEVHRPADAFETAEAWRCAMTASGPSALILTRQALPTLRDRRETVRAGYAQGAYVLADADGAKAVLAASGSEVSLAMKAAEALTAEGIPVRVVSVPCRERFAAQSAEVHQSVLGSGLPVVTLEAGTTSGWADLAPGRTVSLGLDRFGESAPGDEVYAHLGMTVEAVVGLVKGSL
ncbi:MAG: transketolase [Fimbriimonadaceae bacterium]|nr:transketolase [Fimbriimonadaceae bacterium]